MIKLCAFADEAGDLISEQIEALKRNKIEYLELRSVNGINVLDFTLDFAKEIKEELDKNGIKVFSIGSPIGKVDINTDIDEYLEKLKHILEIAKIMEAKNVRMFSFYNAYDKKEVVFEKLNKMVSYAKSFGINLCHENEKDIYGDALNRVIEIKNNVDGIKLVYDPANFIQSNENIKDCLNNLVNNVYYYHIKDVTLDGAVVPAGYGCGLIVEMLNRINKDAILTVEPHLSLFTGYSSIDNTVLKNKIEFKSLKESFDFAVKSLKDCLKEAGYKEVNNGYEKC